MGLKFLKWLGGQYYLFQCTPYNPNICSQKNCHLCWGPARLTNSFIWNDALMLISALKDSFYHSYQISFSCTQSGIIERWVCSKLTCFSLTPKRTSKMAFSGWMYTRSKYVFVEHRSCHAFVNPLNTYTCYFFCLFSRFKMIGSMLPW